MRRGLWNTATRRRRFSDGGDGGSGGGRRVTHQREAAEGVGGAKVADAAPRRRLAPRRREGGAVDVVELHRMGGAGVVGQVGVEVARREGHDAASRRHVAGVVNDAGESAGQAHRVGRHVQHVQLARLATCPIRLSVNGCHMPTFP